MPLGYSQQVGKVSALLSLLRTGFTVERRLTVAESKIAYKDLMIHSVLGPMAECHPFYGTPPLGGHAQSDPTRVGKCNPKSGQKLEAWEVL